MKNPSTIDYMNTAALDASSTFFKFNAAVETGSATSAAGMNFYETWLNGGLPEEEEGRDGQAEWGNMPGPSTW
ncbi:hypothetical protein CVT26_003403 [Gymnopilus dilepis]|uniref:Uncharacterized protein n=1 Tax=Gymnopilus dilepis TaxID=231916 RepID=A0A409Y5F5_9AGAR|nr:hypothetical protein CVT26_003403 [Gymnopilus dilepis]